MSTSPKILLLGSKITVHNLPVMEVSLLTEGCLPAYGYNPGDFIELLAGRPTTEQGRLEQCRAWLAACTTAMAEVPELNTWTYGEEKSVYQFFRKRKSSREADPAHGWFMFHQLLPPEGRTPDSPELPLTDANRTTFAGNTGILVIDDSGTPPQAAAALAPANPSAWVIAMGISVAHWQEWGARFGERFFLFCRLADLETTRMEMDSAVTWETLVANSVRALRSPEVGLWDEETQGFRCHVLVEMFPHGMLYLGPLGIYFRHRRGSMPQKSSPRHKGAVPCHDTLVTALLARDLLLTGQGTLCRNYFFDFSNRVLENWRLLDEKGYALGEGLELPRLDLASLFQAGHPCLLEEDRTDPYFLDLHPDTPGFQEQLELVSSQAWNAAKKQALRDFFPQKSPYAEHLREACGLGEGSLQTIIEVLHHLKEEVSWKRGFEALRLFHLGNLRTTDPAEIEPVVTLHSVMDSYVARDTFQRPLCVGVFGPPGSGKSFSVKEVARVIARKFDTNPFDFFEFNMTQFGDPEEINSAIEPIRASVAKGKVPIVFWDEFDCRYDGSEFGYLRYFLPSMQDGVTYVHGTPYNIGRAIFVFAGGVKSSWEDMEALLDPANLESLQLAKTLKIPDFLSRLRVVLDIDGIDIPDQLLAPDASAADARDLKRILLKRAFIIAHQMDTHWKKAARKTSGLLLRLLLARYKFGARSIEAVIEASGAADKLVYGLPELIGPSAARIHAAWRIDLERAVDQVRKEKKIRAVW